jgi:hypothetical protein
LLALSVFYLQSNMKMLKVSKISNILKVITDVRALSQGKQGKHLKYAGLAHLERFTAQLSPRYKGCCGIKNLSSSSPPYYDVKDRHSPTAPRPASR